METPINPFYLPSPAVTVRWEVDSAIDGIGNRLAELLAEGWEPFAAYDARVYLRRQVMP